MYRNAKNNVAKYLSSVEAVNIYVDEWTRFGLNFVGIFCSTIEIDALLACGIPNVPERSAIVLQEYIKKELRSYNIQDKIGFCSTDCAKNIARAITDLELTWNPCCCHVVNKAVEKALKTIPIIFQIQQKVSSLSNSTKLKQFILEKKSWIFNHPNIFQNKMVINGRNVSAPC